ncbi:prolipoprotein diacylglyceryl transferase family protein [Mangrovimonas sp. TPBH4]|uniref:prolipoprotein diacylglyceryl transferase family protein n=1 Tax=Mangrovimonas sp. TPBH4 TaxID=1645914 RepID=UPI0006B40B9E|nr:prolipoprotein diacylglyceryl transferase family protein [Mangrovimonas sp. TPBH4]
MNKRTTQINKTLYATLFLIILPVMLMVWAKYTEDAIKAPVINSTATGYAMIILGALLMLWAMYHLKKHGKGLPMNAFPPSKFVTSGPYKLFRHPIYWGFGILMIGYFILIKSASGLWLVAPTTILSMIALVMGYETIDLKDRFPKERIKTVLDVPGKTDLPAGIRESLVSLFWVIGLLFLSNYIINLFNDNQHSISSKLLMSPMNNKNGYLPIVYLLFVILTPFFIKRNSLLRYWVITCTFALFISTYSSLLCLGIGEPNVSLRQGIVCFVPAFIILLSIKSFFKQSKLMGVISGVIGSAIIVSQITFARSGVLYTASSVGIFFIAGNYNLIWNFLRKSAEKIANSWQEWVFGKVRVINHGFYVGFGSFVGILLAGVLIGDSYTWGILIFSFVVIVFSALWAQIIEGSEKLKRPYGYYGALVGIIFASLIVWLLGYNVWIIIGAISVAMPWVQAIGRLRCLVNGCCHGSKVPDANIGIKYFHHRSRVCGISHLKGELLHPTPLYAMIWLFLVGFLLISLWFNDFSSPFIFGLYLILTGIGRFVEEAYRGEVQTPIIKGLRLYQWTAILSVLVGIFMTFIHIEIVSIPSHFGWQTILSATIGGLFTTFAMGIDFPYSNTRFSRLV